MGANGHGHKTCPGHAQRSPAMLGGKRLDLCAGVLRDPGLQCWPVDGSGWPSQDRSGEGDSFQLQEFLWREGNRRGVRI